VCGQAAGLAVNSSAIRAACANERSCGSLRGATSNGRHYRDQQLAGGIYFCLFKRSSEQPEPNVSDNQVLRKTAEYGAIALLFATIVLGLTASEAVMMVSLGVFLIVFAFTASGIRGGLLVNCSHFIATRNSLHKMCN
jgi:hypothetical protein